MLPGSEGAGAGRLLGFNQRFVKPARRLGGQDAREHLQRGGVLMRAGVHVIGHAHHADIANWGMGWDSTGPVEVEGKGDYPATGIWNAATTYHFVAKYQGGVEMHVANGGNAGIQSGTKWIGENGNWVWVDRGGLDAAAAAWDAARAAAGDAAWDAARAAAMAAARAAAWSAAPRRTSRRRTR